MDNPNKLPIGYESWNDLYNSARKAICNDEDRIVLYPGNHTYSLRYIKSMALEEAKDNAEVEFTFDELYYLKICLLKATAVVGADFPENIVEKINKQLRRKYARR